MKVKNLITVILYWMVTVIPDPATQRVWTPLYQPTDYASSLYALRKNPRMKAFLDTIAYAEGTAHKDGYRTMYSDILFDSWHDHPRQIICSWYKGKILCSSAAGRYQILQKTWDRIAPAVNAQTFSPVHQDRVAIELIADCQAVEDVTTGRFDEAIVKVNKVWASLPGAGYGQRTVSLDELRDIYDKKVKHHIKHRGASGA